ncbi:uncharacterized protein SETTUDRAFT_32764 [Exserohilum turcica Et28A]|uniref:Heterokaryon incompatibility domain-containing protein n=1 Tax=Exserohilum turcicum (strain 28A) TaxID=671987 RepID=R0JRI7_EXST2|nr:uncharacterized protein SETTUDRAFT_32764 [Exserohilum turcica Et28A]EOA83728.1 hypothetical protein SETTUDRAFT_32764 [Exserohilum turcica Et28A]
MTTAIHNVYSKSLDTAPVPSLVPFSSEPSYHYSGLTEGQIRLLVLQPGPRKAAIRCSLRTVNLADFDDRFAVALQSEISSYEAISYCWKDVPGERTIECDGQPLEIGANLEIALRHFRFADKHRVIWADGICINQNNDEEKSKQVSLMGLIYWIARRVLVWLGEEDKQATPFSAQRAFTVMRKCSYLREEIENNRANLNANSTSRNHGMEGEDAESWEAVRQLLMRNWFTRVWVVQELGLARDATFYCGDSSLTFEDMNRFWDFITSNAHMYLSQYQLNFQMLNLARHYQESTRGNHRLEFGNDPDLAEDICDILGWARGLQCTDPKDAVYAFLGHPTAFKRQLLDSEPYLWYPRNFHSQKPTIIKPDYSKATTVTDVYYQVARTMIEKYGLGMKVLRHIQQDDITIQDDFPSWVPRWHMMEAAPLVSVATKYAAATRFPASPFEVIRRTSIGIPGLRIKAVSISTIYWSRPLPAERHLGQPQETGIDNSYYYPLEDLIQTIHELQNDFPSQDYCDLKSLSATLTSGLTYIDQAPQGIIDDKTSTQHYHDFCAYRRFKLAETRTPGTQNNETLTSPPHPQSSEHGDAKRYMKVLRAGHRGCFLTRRGRLGLGPRITQGGDQLWLPMGADTPFVLRPLDDGNFRVIGQAYLHGAMQGEATGHLTEHDFASITLV